MFRKLWRGFGDRSKAEPEVSPLQDPSIDYESIFFALLDEVTRRPEFNRGWIREFLQQWNVTREELAEWLREFGERLQGGEENRELQERLLRLGRLQEGELCRIAELIGRRLERENPQVPKDEAEAWVERGNQCLFAGDFEGAIACYDKALELKPDNHAVWYNRGIPLHILGQYKLAISSFDKAIEIKPDLHGAWFSRGISLKNLGQYELAISSYDKALELKPDDYQTWYNRGNSFNELGQYELAVSSFDKAIEIKPDLHEAWHNRGNSLGDLRQYELAINSYDKALELKPDRYEVWYNRGNLFNELGQYKLAISSFDKAIEIKPDLYETWFNRGISLKNLGQYKLAISSYDKALELKPDRYEAWNNRGNLFNELGQYKLAISSFDKAIEIKPDLYKTWFNRGVSLKHLERYELAIANYEQGLTYVLKEANPEGWGELHRGKGNIYFYQAQRNQNIQAARIQYGQAITCYNIARQTLEAFAEPYLNLIQNLIKAHLGLGNSETAQQWRITGLELLRELLNAQPTLSQKRNLETKFSGFSRVAVDSLVAQGETIVALETAERDKNRCLTWILDEWKEQVISPSYAEMRQLLNPQTAIVYWHFSDDFLATFILTPDAEAPILLNTLNYDRAQKLQSWIKTWNTQYNDYRTKKNNQSDHPWRKTLTTQLAKLREMLDIDAIVQTLGTLDRLILIPHRDLHRLPLHSLFPTFTTVDLPSIQIGLNLQRKPRSTHPPKLLSVEDPKTDRPQMPYAQLESALTCHFFPNHTQLDDTNATAEKVTQALSDRHTHFHFTGHAGYDTPPENSALILANDARLTAKTIRHLDLSHYQLITLSACETALTGNQTIETEFVGLVSAFLQAGATAVLSTLWNVDEISSTWLILKFYELQTPPAEALKTAQRWLQSRTYETLLEWLDRILAQLPPSHPYRQDIQDEITLIQKNLTQHKIELHQTPYSDPYHWAAFTLTGGTL